MKYLVRLSQQKQIDFILACQLSLSDSGLSLLAFVFITIIIHSSIISQQFITTVIFSFTLIFFLWPGYEQIAVLL